MRRIVLFSMTSLHELASFWLVIWDTGDTVVSYNVQCKTKYYTTTKVHAGILIVDTCHSCTWGTIWWWYESLLKNTSKLKHEKLSKSVEIYINLYICRSTSLTRVGILIVDTCCCYSCTWGTMSRGTMSRGSAPSRHSKIQVGVHYIKFI